MIYHNDTMIIMIPTIIIIICNTQHDDNNHHSNIPYHDNNIRMVMQVVMIMMMMQVVMIIMMIMVVLTMMIPSLTLFRLPPRCHHHLITITYWSWKSTRRVIFGDLSIYQHKTNTQQSCHNITECLDVLTAQKVVVALTLSYSKTAENVSETLEDWLTAWSAHCAAIPYGRSDCLSVCQQAGKIALFPTATVG